ncbi:hypothetical protein ACFVVM_00910 [Nocardia sp. NPDC058176]|uniref:RskA family anti-sigma factor n=1 Tax=Nocardia sp. NPDC058176 TaxID=3346368 RepID=UPI0036DF30DE
MNGQRGPEPVPGVRGLGASTPAISAGTDDRDALRALYQATGAAAFGLALRVLHRRGAAEDVVREGYRRLRAVPWIVGDDTAEAESDSGAADSPEPEPEPAERDPAPDLGTPWGRSAYVATEPRSDTDAGPTTSESTPAIDIAFGTGVTYTDTPPPADTGADAPFDPEQTWLLAQVHRLAVQRLRLDRHDGDDVPWLAASARLGFDDPLDSHCEVFVLAYYGGRTYRAIGRELGLRVPLVNRLLAEGVEQLAEQRTDRFGTRGPWCPPGSILALADAYALDAVAELEHHHIENKLATLTPAGLARFADRVHAVHEVLARLAADDQHTPPRQLESRILADLGATGPPPRRGHWTPRPPWLRRFGSER